MQAFIEFKEYLLIFKIESKEGPRDFRNFFYIYRYLVMFYPSKKRKLITKKNDTIAKKVWKKHIKVSLKY